MELGLVILAAILVVITLIVAGVAYVGLGMRFGAAVLLLVGLLLTTGITTAVWGVSYRNEHWATCHVTGKDRGADNGSYRVYTENCDTLANEDSMFRGKFSSSNVWQEIEPGNTYKFRIVGSRIPFLSQFQNILEVKPANG